MYISYDKPWDRIMKNKSFAFTLAETLIVLVVLAVIMTITVLSTLNFDEAKAKKIQSVSQSFYTNIQNTYLQILFKHTSNGSIVNLEDENGDDEINSEDLANYFIKYTDGEKTTCSDLKNTSSLISDYLNDAQCALISPNIVAGFYLDTNCELEVYAKEYLTEIHDAKTVENACGRIIYGLSDSKGNFTYDLFTIALGKRNVK